MFRDEACGAAEFFEGIFEFSLAHAPREEGGYGNGEFDQGNERCFSAVRPPSIVLPKPIVAGF